MPVACTKNNVADLIALCVNAIGNRAISKNENVETKKILKYCSAGVVGPKDQTDLVVKALNAHDLATGLDLDEDLFSMNLENLVDPSIPLTVRLATKEDDIEKLIELRMEYNKEVKTINFSTKPKKKNFFAGFK